MAKTINQVTLLGRLGRDAETSQANSGMSITKFSIATDRNYKKGDEWLTETTWTSCVAFGKEKVAPYLTKGGQVAVTGRINTRSYEKDGEKKYTTEVVVEDIILCGGGKTNGVAVGGVTEDDELPF